MVMFEAVPLPRLFAVIVYVTTSPSEGCALSTDLTITMFTGIGGMHAASSTTTVVVAADDGHPLTDATTEYVPAFAAVTLAIRGFCCADVNPFGPVHEYVAPATLEAKRLIVEPLQSGPPLPAAGADGAALRTTFVDPAAEGHPVTVMTTL